MRPLEDWIDYMEGEVEPKLLSKLNLLVKHSIDDQMVLKNLRRLRRNLKASDLALQIESQLSDHEFHSNFHKKIIESLSKDNKKTRGPGKNESMPTDAHQA